MSASHRSSPKPYREDLAFVHGVGFGGFAREAAPGLLGMLAAAVVRSGRVVDLGCGTGIWAGRLAESGYEVLGIDVSEAMVRRARRRVPSAEFREQGILTRRITTFRKVDRLYRRADETDRLRLYRAGHVLTELRRAGLRARVVRSYGTLRLRRAEAVLKALAR